MRRFYAEILGLPVLQPTPDDGDVALCLGANRLRMRLVLRERPVINPHRRRLTLEVDSLRAQADRFRDAKVVYRRHDGISFTERRLFVHDPVGHLIELKQVWSF